MMEGSEKTVSLTGGVTDAEANATEGTVSTAAAKTHKDIAAEPAARKIGLINPRRCAVG